MVESNNEPHLKLKNLAYYLFFSCENLTWPPRMVYYTWCGYRWSIIFILTPYLTKKSKTLTDRCTISMCKQNDDKCLLIGVYTSRDLSRILQNCRGWKPCIVQGMGTKSLNFGLYFSSGQYKA